MKHQILITAILTLLSTALFAETQAEHDANLRLEAQQELQWESDRDKVEQYKVEGTLEKMSKTLPKQVEDFQNAEFQDRLAGMIAERQTQLEQELPLPITHDVELQYNVKKMWDAVILANAQYLVLSEAPAPSPKLQRIVATIKPKVDRLNIEYDERMKTVLEFDNKIKTHLDCINSEGNHHAAKTHPEFDVNEYCISVDR